MIVILAVMLCLAAERTVALGEAAGASPSCRRKCGDMDIPYPFGLNGDNPECYRTSPFYFNLTCDEAFRPPRTFWGNIEVRNISVPAAKARFLMKVSSSCYNARGYWDSGTIWSSNLSSKITVSPTDNIFTGVGCDTVALIKGLSAQSFTSGCISLCDNSSKIDDGECSGVGCCQTAVSKGLQSYQIKFGTGNNQANLVDINRCNYAFLVEKGNYTFRKTDLKNMDTERSFPVVVEWVIGDQSCTEAQNNKSDYGCISTNSICVDSANNHGYACNCSAGYHGNPYIPDGCQDINECDNPTSYGCYGTCNNTRGNYTCQCAAGYAGDPRAPKGCQPVSSSTHVTKSSDSSLPTAAVVPVVVASAILVIALSIWLCSLLQTRKTNNMKERWFLQNGGELLQRRISSSGRNEQVFKIFSKREIEKATNKFDQAFELGRGGQGVVYKGNLPNDSRTFAIKKSTMLDGSKIEEFINELVILSKINHRNIVKLIGCCLEEEQPLLVYEIVENGTLSEHIKSGNLPWQIRLKIATEAANAFAYLHSSAEVPIIHRDIKSSNILLDKHLNAKVADFGASRLIPVGEIQVQTIVMGTLGYLDPEYLQSHQLTEKSDVYSFGVVLVELLTGKAPLSYEKSEVERCLAMHFMSCMRTNSLDQILDMRIYDATIVSQMREVASLARRCLDTAGENRPSMKEVATELEGLHVSMRHTWVRGYDEEVRSLLNESPITTHNDVLTTYYNTEESLRALHIESGR